MYIEPKTDIMYIPGHKKTDFRYSLAKQFRTASIPVKYKSTIFST